MSSSFKQAFLGAFITVLAFVLFWAALLAFGGLERSRTIETERERLRESGLPGSRAEVAEWYAMPDGVRNAADLYELAISSARTTPSDSVEWSLIPVVGDLEYPFGEPLPPASIDATFNHLARNAHTIQLLREAAQIEFCRMERDYSRSFYDEGVSDDLLYNVAECRALARTLSAHALVARDTHTWPDGVESIQASYALSRYLGSSMEYTAFLVSIGIVSLSHSAVMEFIAVDRVPDEHLSRLQQIISSAESDWTMSGLAFGPMFDTEDYRAMLDSEYSATELAIEYAFDLATSTTNSIALKHFRGTHDRVQLGHMRFARWYHANRELAPEALIAAWQQSNEEDGNIDREALYPGVLYETIGEENFLKLTLNARAHAYFRTAQIGVAARRYAQKTGMFPESLSEIADYFDGIIPVDPFTGESFNIGWDESRWCVSSVGRDMVFGAGLQSDGEGFDGDDIGFIVLLPQSD